jgi:hypothetical protein
MKYPFALFVIGFLLIGCMTVVSAPATSTVSLDLTASPTDAPLPLNTNAGSDEYCRPPYAILPVGDDNDISEDEIVYELMRIWLRRYSDPNAPAACRIDGFTINEVYYDKDILSQSLEPRGDFMRLVDFSVKLIQPPAEWMSFSGELDQEHWLHLRHPVSVFETLEGYTMQFAYP